MIKNPEQCPICKTWVYYDDDAEELICPKCGLKGTISLIWHTADYEDKFGGDI